MRFMEIKRLTCLSFRKVGRRKRKAQKPLYFRWWLGFRLGFFAIAQKVKHIEFTDYGAFLWVTTASSRPRVQKKLFFSFFKKKRDRRRRPLGSFTVLPVNESSTPACGKGCGKTSFQQGCGKSCGKDCGKTAHIGKVVVKVVVRLVVKSEHLNN